MLGAGVGMAQNKPDPMKSGFENPPDSARPRVWWHWMNGNGTWAEQAGPWIDYLARSSFLLQQGHFGAELIYFYGEDSNLTAIFADKAREVPAGYGFDYVKADALIHELSVSHGRITTPGCTSY
jgi:hypothetical protein